MTITKQVTILIAEDHLISRMGLKMLLQQTDTFTVVGEAEDGESAIQQALELRPDVVIMDVDMPKMGGVEATAVLKKQMHQTKILIFTSLGDDSTIFAALKAGADGYCLKTISAEMLAIAIHSVLNGAAWLDPGIAHKVLRAQESSQIQNKPDLSNSKLKLLSLLEQGKSVDEIAAEMSVHDAMVKGLLNELLIQLKGTKLEAGMSSQGRTEQVTEIKPGNIIAGHYRIDQQIGEGGMGYVYSATHTLLDRKVAIKALRESAAGEADRQRFTKEAKAGAAITHPNLATTFEFGLIENRLPYLVMEFLEGKSLDDFISDGDVLDTKTFVEVFAQICDALDAIHKGGIVHRDLKPSNIMIFRKSDGTVTAKLVDFGIAKLLGESASRLTATGEIMGTPYYMSPEQVRGEGVDYRSDLYSLGCTMYETLTADPPFMGSTAMEVCMSHILSQANATPLKECKVPEPITNLVMSLLKKSPEERPASAAEVRKLLLKA